MLNRNMQSEEQYRADYAEASAEFENIAADKLAEFFGGEKIVASGDFFKKGFDRGCDNQIVSLVIEFFLRNLNRQLEILEVACGTTYSQYSSFGDFFHYGSPWLSRKLKYAFGDLINVKVSDNAADPLLTESDAFLCVFFYRTDKLNIYTASEKVVAEKQWRFPDLQSPVDISKLSNLPAELITVINKVLQDFREVSRSAGELFMRPVTDKLVEKEVFGTEFICSTDYLKLNKTFKTDKFDIVFGRHLNPLPQGKSNIEKKLESFNQSVKSVLSENGKGILHFHDDKSSTNFIHLIKSAHQIQL